METVRATIGPALAGRYTVERELGSGAMALVFLAHDLKHDRNVAIKVLKPELASAIGADRFHREIEIVAGLTHPHILPLHDSGQADGLLYYVMPYVEGESLRDRINREGRLPIPDALRITREVADALGFAHRHNVVHRDVKPGNILLAEDHALLADFGIAHLAEPERATLTDAGMAVGTPEYLSPEQATADRDIDGRSDIYSLGCVLYEALTGEPPFSAASAQALIARHLTMEPRSVRTLRSEVSDGVDAVVRTALCKEPERRFQTAGELAGSIDLVSGGFEALASKVLRRLPGPRHRWLHGARLASLITAAVVLLALGLFAVRSVRQRPAFAGAYPTYAVFPYQGEELSAEELDLADQAARYLYLHLHGWESITVVNGSALEGPTSQVVEAGIGLPTRSVNAGLELADRYDASHMIHVDASLSGNSLTLNARVYLLPGQTPDHSLTAKGPRQDVWLISADLALQILDINGEPADIDQLRDRSPHPAALQQHTDGWEALLDWRLAEAEAYFRRAVEQDSTFALAHYHLALTMYWRTVRDPERILDGESIARHVGQANRFGVSPRLRAREQEDVGAFTSFWDGDYEIARERYAEILRDGPTRIDALVMAGAVEYADPWLALDADGRPVGPRGDLNRAMALFDSASRLDRFTSLAWGQLFDIERQVARTAYHGTCPAYVLPDGSTLPPYVIEQAVEARAFCPYMVDGTIRWHPAPLPPDDRERSLAEVTELGRRIEARLNRWAAQSDQPRPHEELTDRMLWDRSARGCETDPFVADSLLGEARLHFDRALAARHDTTPEDRLRLGVLLLAGGSESRAKAEADRALQEVGDWRAGVGPPPPKFAGNIYLASDDAQTVADIVEAVSNRSTWSVPDSTVPGGAIAGGPVWGTLMALDALGLAGDTAGMTSRFERVRRTWESMGYTQRQQALLRSATTSTVGPALIRQPERRDSWFQDWDLTGREVPSVWKGLMLSEEHPDEARAHLRRAVAEVEEAPPGRRRAIHYYMPIQLAERLGDDALVADLAARAARCPLRLDNIDFGWGMRRYLVGGDRK